MDIISDPISLSDFYRDYLVENKPCLIKNSILSSWKCVEDWISDGQINFDFLLKKFGHSTVPVSNCKQKYFNSQLTQDMKFGEYIEYWKGVIDSGHDYTQNECLYLKDWHFMLEFSDYLAYKTPEIFSYDWLNEYCLSKSESDYRFVYMGPKGSSTPLHKDVFSSFSWSANIVGQKEWILIPPGKESDLSMPSGHLPFDIKMKLKSQEFKDSFEVIEVVQDAGQAIFVPSGWIHQVLNTKDTISINHNWFNACNINFIYKSMQDALMKVQNELEDLKKEKDITSWNEECQTLLRLHHGLNKADFCDILQMVINRLSIELKETNGEKTFIIQHEIESIQKLLQNNLICDELKYHIDYFSSELCS